MTEAVAQKTSGGTLEGWFFGIADFKKYVDGSPLMAAQNILSSMAEIPHRLSQEIFSEINHSSEYLSKLADAQIEASTSLLSGTWPNSWSSAPAAFAARAIQLNTEEFDRQKIRMTRIAKDIVSIR